jgi:serine-type D-Ala-D-Ala carboxypeptidase (penicillin-binding protein 5/6)
VTVAGTVSTDSYFLKSYPGALGINTGFTSAAGHTLLFEAARNGRVLIGDVPGSSISGFAAAALDSAKILN